MKTPLKAALIALSLLSGTAAPATAVVGIGVSVSGVSIGIHVPAYPELVPVPGYPVYYAPQLRANYFFYDGFYWLYHDDRWYVSDWYDGPWDLVDPDDVPLFVLRVPVRYYPAPPLFFSGWYLDAPPLWHVHWGHRWTRYYHGWEHWDHRVVYAPAPLPHYQRHYAGAHYPRGEHRRLIRREHYHYRPHDTVVRRHDQQRAAQHGLRQRETFARQPWQQTPLRQNGPAVQQQRLQPRQETERRGQAFSQPRPQAGPAVRQQHAPAAQRALRHTAERRAQPSPGPQLRERAPRSGSEAHQWRAAPERRQAMQARVQERGGRRQ